MGTNVTAETLGETPKTCIEMIDLDELSTTSASNSLDSLMLCDSSHSSSLNSSRADAEELSSLKRKSVADPNHETPRVKRNGRYCKPVRRRLIFTQFDETSSDSNIENKNIPRFQCVGSENKEVEKERKNEASSSITRVMIGSSGGDTHPIVSTVKEGSAQKKPSKTSGAVLAQKQLLNTEGAGSVGGSRKIAQLVVWTKNFGKQTVKKEDQNAKNLEEPQKLPPASEPALPDVSKVPNSEGDLFFVQYPVRPANETSKGKVKVPKRQRKSLSPPIPNQKKKRLGSKPKRSKNPSSEEGSSSGRAYRAYFHSCLEKQLQNPGSVEANKDFKVDKLFQPDRGTLPIPGEITVPLSIEAEEQTLFEIPFTSADSAVVFDTSDYISSNVGQITDLKTPSPEKSLSNPQDKHQYLATPAPSPISEDKSVGSFAACSNAEVVERPPQDQNEQIEEGPSFPVFELPDQFTVTTEATTNEFDLLIQNVVREEMVDGGGDDQSYETCQKKMKLNNSSENCSRSSSQEGLIMDETGKPRCTYTELIEKALTETGGLTVSEIYSWISERYPFYKPDDDRWKNSVRHNLSINPYFKKGEKARSGAGHLWTISEESKGLRPSMVSGDQDSFENNDRRKCPYDPAEIIMPMESETDRAVANILGRYLSECRASQEGSKEEKKERKSKAGKNVDRRQEEQMERDERDKMQVKPQAVPQVEQESTTTLESHPHSVPQNPEQEQPQPSAQSSSSGATCDAATAATQQTQFNINELSSGQFTVDLSGITIPEGGSINFEDLVNNGRLIYIQTDPEANKENESAQAVILNEALIPELANLTNSSNHVVAQTNDDRYQSFYSDSLNLDHLGFGKVDSMSSVSFPQDDILAAACAQLISDDSQHQQDHQDLTNLDHVIPMSSYDVPATSEGNTGTGLSENIPPISEAALYESKELGISYTYQAETNQHDLLQ